MYVVSSLLSRVCSPGTSCLAGAEARVFEDLERLTQPLQQSQTNRTDNQQRPGSQGYGAGGAGPSGAGQVYPGAEGAASLLAAQQGEPGGDASGFMYAPQPGHNGTGAEGPY